MHSANGRPRYNVTLSLIGWVHTQDDPCRNVDKPSKDEVGIFRENKAPIKYPVRHPFEIAIIFWFAPTT